MLWYFWTYSSRSCYTSPHFRHKSSMKNNSTGYVLLHHFFSCQCLYVFCSRHQYPPYRKESSSENRCAAEPPPIVVYLIIDRAVKTSLNTSMDFKFIRYLVLLKFMSASGSWTARFSSTCSAYSCIFLLCQSSFFLPSSGRQRTACFQFFSFSDVPLPSSPGINVCSSAQFFRMSSRSLQYPTASPAR